MTSLSVKASFTIQSNRWLQKPVTNDNHLMQWKKWTCKPSHLLNYGCHNLAISLLLMKSKNSLSFHSIAHTGTQRWWELELSLRGRQELSYTRELWVLKMTVTSDWCNSSLSCSCLSSLCVCRKNKRSSSEVQSLWDETPFLPTVILNVIMYSHAIIIIFIILFTRKTNRDTRLLRGRGKVQSESDKKLDLTGRAENPPDQGHH